MTAQVTREKNSSGNYAGLTTAIIPDKVLYMGNYYDVTAIDESAFYGCTSLQSVSIGENVRTLGSMAFYDCSSLQSVTLPKDVQTIGNGAFAVCSSLTAINVA